MSQNKQVSEKRVNAYRLQYWLYAVLAKRFGASVRFKRDSLRHIYDMHRHSFEVSGVPMKTILNHLKVVLLENGYVYDKSFSLGHFTKKCDYGSHVYEINIGFNEHGVDILSIFPTVYKNLKK